MFSSIVLFVLQLGNTPLHDAARFGLKLTVELLLSNGADVNSVNKVSSYKCNCDSSLNVNY